MVFLRKLVLFFALYFMLGATVAEAERRVALVIGNNQYQSVEALAKAANDARSVGQALREMHFDNVIEVTDADRKLLDSKVREFIRDIHEGDTAFFFYAGHGVAVGSVNYILPVDFPAITDKDDETLIVDEARSVDSVLESIQSKNPGRVFMILDACRNNPLPKIRSRSLGRSVGLVSESPATGVFMLYSAGFGQQALDALSTEDPDPNSVFTRSLLPLLRKQGLSQVDLAKALQSEVKSLASRVDHLQNPAYYDQIDGLYYLNGKPDGDEPTQDTAASDWLIVKDSKNQELVQAFIEQHRGNAVYRVLAQQLLAALQKSTPKDDQSVRKPGAVEGEIRIGLAGPMSGQSAIIGEQLREGAELAAADINAAGGINGRRVRLIVADDASDPRQGIVVANKLASDGVKFVVGHYDSDVSISASDIYALHGIMQITPASMIARFTDRGLWNTFSISSRSDEQAMVAAKYIRDHFRDAKIAVIHDGTPYGQALADKTKSAINQLGINEVIYEHITPGQEDLSALVERMSRAGVSFIYYGGQSVNLGQIVRQMSERGVRAKLMSGESVDFSEFAAIVGDAADGTLMTFRSYPPNDPNAAEVVERFRRKLGYEPAAYTLYAYAALQVIAEAAKVAGSLDPREAAEAAKIKGPFKTVLGDLGFDAKGDRTPSDYVVNTWKKGADGKYNPFENL